MIGPETLKQTAVFSGMSDAEIADALQQLRAVRKKYSKGEVILHAGSVADRMGIVLEGSVTIENNDVWGNKTILSHVGPGQIFAETYALLEDEPLLVDVVANENCRVLFLRIGGLVGASVRDGGPSGSWQPRLTANMISILAHKNLILSGRSFHTSPKTIRARIMSYLTSISIQQPLHTSKQQTSFDIPFDRQQMADYLNVERTALSKELRKMKDDGLIDFHKNHFTLK